MSNLFLDVPFDLSVRVLSEWLDLEGWLQLDFSFAWRVRRTEWLHLIQADQVVAPVPNEENYRLQRRFRKWCLARRVKVSYLHLRCGDADVLEFAAFAERNCRHTLSHVKMEEWDKYESLGNYFGIFGVYCTKIRKVELINCHCLGGLDFLLLRNHTTVETLRLINVSNQRLSANLGHASHMFSELTELTVGHRAEEENDFLEQLLVRSPNLRKLHLMDVIFDEDIIEALETCSQHLKEVIIYACAWLKRDCLVLLGELCSQLERFVVSLLHPSEDIDEGVRSVISRSEHLHTVQASSWKDTFSDALLRCIAEKCGANLLHLELCGVHCRNCDVGTLALARCCRNLRVLSWSVQGISQEAECALLSALPLLQELRGPRLGDRALQSAVDHCPLLWSLCLDGAGAAVAGGGALPSAGVVEAPHLTAAGVEYALEHGAALKRVTLMSERFFETASSAHWRERRPEVRVEHCVYGSFFSALSLVLY